MAVTLKDEKLLDTWGTVMEAGAGHAITLMRCIQELLKNSELPGVAWEKVDAQTGMLKGLFGKRREYLMVSNEAMKDYRMYVGARDYGKHLNISWFLTVEPGFFKQAYSVWRSGDFKSMSFNLDIFDNQDLRAYVTSVHHCCVKKAVEDVAKQIGEDASKFDWKSKGFLEVW